MAESRKQYRARMRREHGADWWNSKGGPTMRGKGRLRKGDEFDRAEEYVKTKSGRALMLRIPSSEELDRAAKAKGWPEPHRSRDSSDARVMEDGTVVYMHYEWVWALVLVPLHGSKAWRAYSVDPQERDRQARWPEHHPHPAVPVFAVKDFPTKAALFKALRALKGPFALGDG